MKFNELQKKLEQLVPPALAWKKDNVGVQIGKKNLEIKNILVALDVTMEVVREAIAKKANVIITHHPLLFQPLRTLTSSTRAGEIALLIAEHNITLYAAHTNLDSVKWGVNFVLAEKLGLRTIEILSPMQESLTKIVVFVPQTHLESVAQAMHAAGGGTFTKYEECSFRTDGIGTFKGINNASPFLGKVGQREKVNETKLEMLAETWKIPSVLSAMRRAHPYEEIAYDVYPLSNENTEYGLGAFGTLPHAVSAKNFLTMIKKKLHVPALRYSGKTKKNITRVAVCGGAGYDLLGDALQHNADAFVTADVKYHDFQNAERDILLIDAGHFETEHHVLPVLAKKISDIVHAEKNVSKVFITQKNTNPVHYF